MTDNKVRLLPNPSHITGPVWTVREDGEFHLPEKTLGWGILAWMFTYVLQPGGPSAGEAFLPTDEQARFILWWYAIDPDTGRFTYRNGVLRRLKGWGKDPLAAALSLAELCGPVAFSHFDPVTGQPVGKPRPSAWIQVAAVSQDQTRNTFTLFPAMASAKLRETFGLDINKTIIFTKAGGMIEAVTSSPLSMEGKRPTFVIKNETQWWLENNSGHDMSSVIAGNVDKAAYGGCRSLAICNAHIPGQESIGEQDWDAYQKISAGQAIDTGLLYDAVEAPAGTPVSEIPSPEDDPEGYAEGIEKLRAGLLVARGDAVWLDMQNIVSSILDVRNPVTESRRKFLNQINASEDSWIAPHEWDLCMDANIEPLRQGDKITLGFDGSKGNDWTALVACRVEDAAIFLIKAWNPERYNGEVPRETVNDTVEWCFSYYDVVAMRADVKEFESYVDTWGAKYGRKLKVKASGKHPVGFDMRSNQKVFTLDCERFEDAVIEQEIIHDGNMTLRSHVTNAHRRPNNHGISIGKATKDSSRKIDAAVCAVLAFGIRQEYMMSKSNKGRKVVFFN